MNILLIDDESNLLKLLRLPLTKRGHTITEAHNGKQGWDLFLDQSNVFDVIVTDIRMPVLNGVELLKRLREKDYDIPVIIISAYEDIQSSIEVLRLGAFDFLLKPFKAKDLLAILERLEALQAHRKKPLEDISCFTEQINISIRSQTRFVTSVVSLLQERIKLFCKLQKIEVRNIGLCLHEALVNAVIHGNLEIPSELKNQSPQAFEKLLHEREASPSFANRQVYVRCQITTTQITFEIEDQGIGFNPEIIKHSDPLQMLPTGRGILIITSIMDEVCWNSSGTCITMRKHFYTTAR
jgi:DNA-binding response OmpR family regulator